MKLLLLSILGIIGFLVLSSYAASDSDITPSLAEVYFNSQSASLVSTAVTADAYVVFVMDTGEVLFEKNADTELPIASVTKLFTAREVLESDQIDTKIIISEADVATTGRAGKLESGQAYSLRELLFPLLLESSNDAAATIERTVPTIISHKVHLDDLSGLSDKNIASAEALKNEVGGLFSKYRHIFDITRLKQYIGENTGWINNSPVRDLPGYIGGKHGYTEAANRTLVAVFLEDSLGGLETGYIILGSDDLRSDTILLRSAVANSALIQ